MRRAVLRPYKTAVASDINWEDLVTRALPQELPRRIEPCRAVLSSIFQRDLPEGVLNAAASLVSLELEPEARVLLIDFFRERRGAARIARRLEMQWIFQKRRSEITARLEVSAVAPVPSPFTIELQDSLDEAALDWMPAAAEELPLTDDSDLRLVAGESQNKVSETREGYRVGYEGESIPGWDEIDSWLPTGGSTATANTSAKALGASERETQLLFRLASLGNEGIALLRYFHDNPGDGAKHAAYILDYEIAEVNKLLNNRLAGYVRRHQSGGWACVDWVASILELVPK